MQKRVRSAAAPLEYNDRRLFVTIAVRIIEQGRFHARCANAARTSKHLRFSEIVGIDDGARDARQVVHGSRKTVGIARRKYDCTLVGRHRPGIPVDRRNGIAHHFELSGWPETKVTIRFWLASILCSVLGWAIVR